MDFESNGKKKVERIQLKCEGAAHRHLECGEKQENKRQVFFYVIEKNLESNKKVKKARCRHGFFK